MKTIRLFILLCILIRIAPLAFSQGNEPSLRVQSIEKDLLKNSKGIIRKSQTNVTIKDNDEILIENEIAVTILNATVLKEAPFVIPYDNFSEVRNIKGDIYDANGDWVRGIKNEEISDVSANSKYELFNDIRYKLILPYYSQLPFTYKYKYKIYIKGYIKPPSWQVIHKPDFSIETASLTVQASASLKLLHENHNVSSGVEYTLDTKKYYSWVINNFQAVIEENNLPDSMEIYPVVNYFPEQFSIDRNAGSFKSWADFGRFYYQLNENSNTLSAQAKNEIDALVSGINDVRAKIKIIYQWMQSQTRYVSIQKGIGGWKSFDANYVYEKKFGDCKALVNYMQASLNYLQIKSHPVLIYAGKAKGYFNVNLPCNYFNHVILCIPLQMDTLWLECTSNKQPFDYLGSFTSNRFGLLINDTSSSLIETPVYGIKENQISLSASIYIDSTGNSTCNLRQFRFGETQDEARLIQANASSYEKEDWIRNLIPVADYELKKHAINSSNLDTPLSIIDIELNSRSISVFSNQRLFIHPKVFKNQLDNIRFHTNRIYPLKINAEFSEADSIQIAIPKNYFPESKDKKEVISCEFGEYKLFLNYEPSTHSFQWKDSLTIWKKTINPDKINEWIDFREKVDLARNSTIVCIKK